MRKEICWAKMQKYIYSYKKDGDAWRLVWCPAGLTYSTQPLLNAWMDPRAIDLFSILFLVFKKIGKKMHRQPLFIFIDFMNTKLINGYFSFYFSHFYFPSPSSKPEYTQEQMIYSGHLLLVFIHFRNQLILLKLKCLIWTQINWSLFLWFNFLSRWSRLKFNP